MLYLRFISFLCLIIGVILIGIWVAQQVSSFKMLDNPSTGAGLFIFLGLAISIFVRRSSAK